MGKRIVVPFGPQHPVLPEPIHLDLVLEDEKVVEVVPSLGFVHRGLELLSRKKEFKDMVYVAERICGICSFIHSLTYCQGIEKIMSIEVPERAQYLRVFWSELSRIHSHLLWLGFAADSAGYESLFMHSWRVREKILDIIEETAGGRVIFGACKIGGVRLNDPLFFHDEKAGGRGREQIACNPLKQADLLNQAATDLNVVVGLCVGIDSLFTRHSQAPVSTMIVKDKSLAHNPVGAGNR